MKEEEEFFEKQLSQVSQINRKQYSKEIRILLDLLVESSVSFTKLKMMGAISF